MTSRPGGASSSSNNSRPRVGGSAVATSSAAAATDATVNSQTLLRAFEHGAKENAKLAPAWEMVQRTATMASTIVKGTDSQRTFNVEFANLCRTCLLSAGELEDAAFEVANPGRRAWDARSDEIAQIGDADLLRALAQHVAAQSSSLTPQYLEHIASSAAQKVARQHRKRERPQGSSRGTGTTRPVSRTGSRRTPTGGPDDSTLGLLDESATTQAALEQLLAKQDLSASTGGSGDRPTLPSAMPDPAACATAGLFYSKASARTKSVPGKTFDLRNPALRLSSIPELSQRLQPWLLPMAQYAGLAVDRVAPEKDRRPPHPHHTRHQDGTGAAGPASRGTSGTAANALAVLDVCGAQTPLDLLQRWEARESMLSALRPTAACATLPTAPPPLPPPKTSSPPRDGDAPSTAVEQEDAGETGPQRFFVDPSTNTRAGVPKAIVAAQVHFGVWKLEFPRYTES